MSQTNDKPKVDIKALEQEKKKKEKALSTGKIVKK
jgi:hypothetical protein